MEKLEMIVMDMDGTLLTGQQNILPMTQDVLMTLQKRGIALVLASGRDIESLRHYGQQLKMEQYSQSAYIVLNGLEIYDSRCRCLHKEKRLTYQDLRELAWIAKKSLFDMVIFFEESLYILKYAHTGIMEDHFIDRQKHEVTCIGDIPFQLFDNIKKVAWIQAENIMAHKLPRIQDEVKGRFEVCMVEKDWVEVNPAHATKGQALLKLSQLTHTPIAHIMAFGNGENDIDMLKTAGLGVAMGNSFVSVQQAADAICLDNEHDGIGMYLKDWL